jgi:glycosyltransferase involved in cell wall biosynthesis
VKTKLRKIAILADFPWSFFDKGATGRGGGQACTWLAQLAKEFAKQSRYQIHWISLDRSLTWGTAQRREWGSQFFTKLPVGKAMVDMALHHLPSRLLLMREIKRIQPDLVHCWGTERSYPVVCSLVKIPSILSMQGVISNLSRQGYLPDLWIWNQMAKLEPKLVRSATVVSCESEWAIQKVREFAPDADLRQVEYGVHPSFREVTWQPDLLRPYALFVGSLAKHKGVDILLEALAQLDPHSWSFKFAGDGPLLDAVVNCGLPHVQSLGVLAWKDLQLEMQQASFLIHPTLADSSPNVVKEARVIGLPVITSIHGGQAGYIRDGENGFIVNPLEPQGLAHALQKLMTDPELIRKMGKARHDEDRAYFTPSNTANGFLEIYSELLKEY